MIFNICGELETSEILLINYINVPPYSPGNDQDVRYLAVLKF